jgi:hypothetical protein
VIATKDSVLSVDGAAGWDGVSPHPQEGHDVANKESEMDWPEHQRIVFAAAGLLANLPTENINAAGELLVKLKAAYNSDDYVLKVTKGIHQPYTNSHIQVTLFESDGTTKVSSFHLNVSPAVTVLADRFQWKPVQFTAEAVEWIKGQKIMRYAEWPVGANHVFKNAGANQGAPRRNSISSVDLEARVAANAEREARKQEKAAEEAERLKANPQILAQREGQIMLNVLKEKKVILPRGTKISEFMNGVEITVNVVTAKAPNGVPKKGKWNRALGQFIASDGTASIGGLSMPK